MSRNKSRTQAFIDFFASKKFFYIVMGLFIMQASWIALSNNYGSPHDEKYHFGLVQVYSHNLSPFINSQPTEYDQYGDVTRNSSYLYHYLMSFPYRVINSISSSITKQVIFLRLFNILFVAIGLFVFKKILDDLFKKPIISNLALFGAVMIPVFTYVASGVNYDNLVFLGFATTIYLTIKLIGKFDARWAALWLSVIILTILVKFSFAPLGLAVMIGTLIYYFNDRSRKIPEIKKSFKDSDRLILIVLSLTLILVGGLFVERYVGNMVSYGSPIPDCAKVLDGARCKHWSPWERNAQAQKRNDGRERVGLLNYAGFWFQKMESTGFGIYKTGSTREALLAPGFMGWILLIAFLLFSALSLRYIISRPVFMIILGSLLFYIIVLFVINYRDYQKLGSPIAIQARYLILALPLLIGFMLHFMNRLIRMKESLRVALVIIWLAVFLQGGLVTYVLSSDSTWWWPRSKVITTNKTVQKILRPIIPGT